MDATLLHEGPQSAPAPVILFVDDEPGILNALRRLFRQTGYRVLIAGSGVKGLELLRSEAVDLVVSDMRMPEMDGAQFLEEVRRTWPETKRILLTGYSDIASITAAINRGEIYRYVTKPWDDPEMLMTVRDALSCKQLEAENARLQALTSHQNDELRSLNAELETRVAQRTTQLSDAAVSLQAAHEELKRGFLTVVRVLAGLIELRAGRIAGHSRRVADHAKAIGTALGLQDHDLQDLLLAALLHDIGMLGLPDSVLATPAFALTGRDRAEYRRHPVSGQMALMEIAQLRGPAVLVRHHHERFDGKGFPDGLAGDEIPLGARILAVADDLDAFQAGLLISRRIGAEEAVRLLREGRGTRYDPVVVDALDGATPKPQRNGDAAVERRPCELRPGMLLARDLVRQDGLLLLAKDYVLDDNVIEQVRRLEARDGLTLSLWVRPDSDPPTATDINPNGT